MADADRVVRQWLETDAAFGVAEVPVPKRASQSPPVKVPPAAAASRGPVRPAPAAPRTPAQSPLMPGLAFQTPPAKKVAPAIPAAPSGDIVNLPALTRSQKDAALAALRQQIERESIPYINDISTRIVFGEGDSDAALMFVGEGPGAEEDRTGRPFVGRSGQLLDKMITAIGLQRGQVFIANVVKLRCAEPVDGGRLQDRPPNPDEVARGIPYLHRQIEIIRPTVIVTLGAPAVKHLTGTTIGVMKLRGTWLSYRGIPVMPTYHPSFVLRAYTEENRRKVWSDLKEAVKKTQGK